MDTQSMRVAAQPPPLPEPRAQLLAGLPLTEQVFHLEGIATPVLEGGEGPPLVLLHGPGEHAPKWLNAAPELVKHYRVVAPDLPGHGASRITGRLDIERTLAWLGALIKARCTRPPILVGQILGGAIAARFASRYGDRLAGLVLVDSLGLADFQPAPDFGAALMRFSRAPTAEHHDALWQLCAYDLRRLQMRMGERWQALKAYNLDRAGDAEVQAAVQAMMGLFAMQAIPEAELARITTPTALIWGRHDLATPLAVAEAAATRHGWPLQVIEDAADDPPIEQPEAFIAALQAAVPGHERSLN